MDEEKRNKVKVAIVINAIILIFILVAVLIAQFVVIGVTKRRLTELEKELKTLVGQVETREEFIEKYEADERIRQLIMMLAQSNYSKEKIMELLGLTDEGETLTILVVDDPIA